MMRRFTILLLTVLAGCDGEDAATDEDVEDLPDGPLGAVLQELGLVADDADAVLVTGLEAPLPAGTVLAPEIGTPDDVLELADDRLVYVVDGDPHALLGHAVRWALVDPDSLEVDVLDRFWLPTVDGGAWEPDVAWGEPVLPIDDQELEVPAPSSLVQPYEADDLTKQRDCGEEWPKRALLVQGLQRQRRGADGENVDFPGLAQASYATLQTALEARDWQVYVIDVADAPDGTGPGAYVLDQVHELTVGTTLKDLMIWWVGHGVPGAQVGLPDETSVLVAEGEWGEDNEPLTMTQLVGALEDVEVQELDLFIEACFSGGLWPELEAATEAAERHDLDIHLTATSQADQTSIFVTNQGAPGMTARVNRWLGSVDAEQDLDLRAAKLGTIRYRATNPTTGQIEARSQDPLYERIEAREPVLYLYRDAEGRCALVSELDEHDYFREITVRGMRFGEEDGELFLDKGCQDWVPLEVTYWAEGAVTAHVPMRAEGFPADGVASILTDPEDCEGEALGGGMPGQYRLKLRRADGIESPLSVTSREPAGDAPISTLEEHAPRVQLAWQQYCQVWEPPAREVEFHEMWLPVTPAQGWTEGATFLASSLQRWLILDADYGVEGALELTEPTCRGVVVGPDDHEGALFGDGERFLRVGEGVFHTTPDWSFAQAPGWRGAKCHEASPLGPEGVSYWGFCRQWPDPYLDGASATGVDIWVLVYD